MTADTVYKNAKIVTEQAIINGSISIKDGMIADICEGHSAVGEDMDGDYIFPGLIELHTDHLEQHYSPRPGVTWNLTSAIQSHDVQVAASGITTVFDCLRIGSDEDGGFDLGEMRAMSSAIARAQVEDRLRADHLIHLRCEVSADNVIEQFAEFDDDISVGLVSLMDHAPGQRQFVTMDQYTLYYKEKRGLTDTQFEEFVARRKLQSERNSSKNRQIIARICHQRGISIASHDDATLEHVEESKHFGVTVAEFPTTFEAAQASHNAGLGVLMGAPNVVRGGSHSGNIAAHELAKKNVLDILSSDYVPFSLVYAPFVLSDAVEEISLPNAVAMVSANPARQVGLDDRGRLATGLRADFSRVRRLDGDVPVVRSVWREGRRIV